MTEEISLASPVTHALEERRSDAQVDLAGLVEDYSAVLFRVAFSVVRNQADAEDVVQDAFVRVLEHRRTLPAVRDMRVWLIRIAWNLALDRRRRVRPEQMDAEFARALVGGDLPADVRLQEAQRMQAALAAIESLPRAERQVLLLSALDELGTAELAKVMDKTESAVRALLFRARTRLRERMERGER